MFKPLDRASRQDSHRRPRKVCVIDPRPGDYRHLVGDESLAGSRLEFLASGREALQAAIFGGVDVWVVNVELPDLSGLELCEMLRARDRKATIYLVTDQYHPDDERQAWLRGASMFRAKPAEVCWFAHLAGAEPVAAAHV